MTDRNVSEFTDEEVLERVEAAAAGGNQRAALILRTMLEERAAAGAIHIFSLVEAAPYLVGDRHARNRGFSRGEERGGFAVSQPKKDDSTTDPTGGSR